MARVSVIVPTYNRAHLIRDTIESVLAQTFQDFEIVVVDDGSSDGTREVVGGIQDHRLKYIQQEHLGIPAVGRNLGLRMSKGEYVSFLDSDDLMCPDNLECFVSYLDGHPEMGMVYGRMEYLGSEGWRDLYRYASPVRTLRSGDIFEWLALGNKISQGACLIRRRCVDEVGPLDESPGLCAVEDYELNLRIARRYQIGCVDRVVARYRRHENNITTDRVSMVLRILHVLGRVEEKTGKLSMILKRRHYAMVFAAVGAEYLRSMRWKEARIYLRHAFLAWPFSFRSIFMLLLTTLDMTNALRLFLVARRLRGKILFCHLK